WRQPRKAQPAAAERTPRADLSGTVAALIGIALTTIFMNGSTPAAIASFAAIGTGVSLAFSVAADARAGLRNLIRADLLAIVAFYFLTLFEFLFPQPAFNLLITLPTTRLAIWTCEIGLVGLLIGRHLVSSKKQPFQQTLTHEIPAGWMIVIFWLSFIIGYSDMLVAVNFNIFEMIDWFMAPRFSQPWQRGKFGDWKALLHELSLFIFLIPPLGGIIMARR